MPPGVECRAADEAATPGGCEPAAESGVSGGGKGATRGPAAVRVVLAPPPTPPVGVGDRHRAEELVLAAGQACEPLSTLGAAEGDDASLGVEFVERLGVWKPAWRPLSATTQPVDVGRKRAGLPPARLPSDPWLLQ